MRPKRIFLIVAFIGLFFSCGTISHAATFLFFNSEPGDYMGQGQVHTLTSEDGAFSVNNSQNVVTINYKGSTWWTLNFAVPQGKRILPGPYEGATRYPFHSPTGTGLNVDGDGRGCNTLTGRFDVLEAVYSAAGKIERFAADFEQHCEGMEPALYGSVRYNATVGFQPKVSITANDSHTPTTVFVGDSVKIELTMEAGDKKGAMVEKWLGMYRPSINRWFKSTPGRNFWLPSAVPHKWETVSLADFTKIFYWQATDPGVYVFVFAADEQLDRRMDTQYVDQVVVTVKKPAVPTSADN